MPDPQTGPGEVVVAIAATSVNPFDAKLRDGAYKALLPMPKPLIRVAGHMSLPQPDA
jgi:NADPH:quinone reductase-like Zn-dependent oxidoreductase